MQKFIEYFDLASALRAKAPHPTAADGQARRFHWIPQYIALLLGVFAQPMFQKFMDTGMWDLAAWWKWLIAASIVALMAFPAVYKGSFDPSKPIFVQLCVIFTSGMGWQSLTKTALEAAGVGRS